MSAPDVTAIGAAFGRAAHVLLDDPPYVFEDTLSITLAGDDLLRAARWLTPDGRLDATRDDRITRWRGTFVARARLVEDLVADRLASGEHQYVILGAGLDTYAQRKPDATSRLRIFEVDEPKTQRWKQGRLRELGLPIPSYLHFVSVDFESGASWVEALATAGFDPTRPSVVASTGVTQYISVDALATTMREAATLAPGTTFVCTFMLPADQIDVEERELRVASEKRSAALGFPWISSYSPNTVRALATAAGFDEVRHISAGELNARYFAGRRDGARAMSSEHLITATRSK